MAAMGATHIAVGIMGRAMHAEALPKLDNSSRGTDIFEALLVSDLQDTTR